MNLHTPLTSKSFQLSHTYKSRRKRGGGSTKLKNKGELEETPKSKGTKVTRPTEG
jgi:hypothetical protein